MWQTHTICNTAHTPLLRTPWPTWPAPTLLRPPSNETTPAAPHALAAAVLIPDPELQRTAFFSTGAMLLPAHGATIELHAASGQPE